MHLHFHLPFFTMKLNWAERWAVNNPSRPIQQRLEIRWMKRRRPLAPGSVVLEVGCGRGVGAALIQKEFQPAVLQAMDLDPEMLRRGKTYLPEGERKEISFYVADVRRVPARVESLDAVFGFGVLHHVPDWESALMEIVRVLKPGGVYYLEELYPSLYQNFITKHILLHPADRRFRSEDLKTAIKGAGLRLDHLIEHPKVGILGIASKSSGQKGNGK
ncbi:MAG TPA: class I SAM-dependent methyltransferase [Thermodesulfobacteriota bacterium]|nr:class I SAM-dependent methyltransferase [Thermodesulfobacteriota bacterium]